MRENSPSKIVMAVQSFDFEKYLLFPIYLVKAKKSASSSLEIEYLLLNYIIVV